MIAVISKNRQEFKYWLHNINRQDQSKFHCVTQIRDIEGRVFTDVIRIGQYYDLQNHKFFYDSINYGIEMRKPK